MRLLVLKESRVLIVSFFARLMFLENILGRGLLRNSLLRARSGDQGARAGVHHVFQPTVHDHHRCSRRHRVSWDDSPRKVRKHLLHYDFPDWNFSVDRWKLLLLNLWLMLYCFLRSSIIGAIFIVCGLYIVVWGKSKDRQAESTTALMPDEKVPTSELPITDVRTSNGGREVQ